MSREGAVAGGLDATASGEESTACGFAAEAECGLADGFEAHPASATIPTRKKGATEIAT
jgi:hypothetical protein